VFTARYALSPCIKQIRFVFKGLIWCQIFFDPAGTCGTYTGEEKGVGVLVGKSEGNRPRGTGRLRCEDSIRMYVKEMASEVVDWIAVSQDRNRWRALVNQVMKLQIS
jgi:hypothetical protein